LRKIKKADESPAGGPMAAGHGLIQRKMLPAVPVDGVVPEECAWLSWNRHLLVARP
jgi:hypothetical protein